MGNVCGCVRGPKEDCYVDPKKAPLNPESKHFKGRRYFQRKNRKSEDFQLVDPPRSPVSETSANGDTSQTVRPQDLTDGSTGESRPKLERSSEVEKHLSGQASISRVGEVPVLIPKISSANQTLATRSKRIVPVKSDEEGSTVEGKLHCINTTFRGIAAKDGLLVKKLLRRQLRRAVSFGAVEHMLRTLGGHHRPDSEDAFAKIICGSQVHRRRRRRAYTCSGFMEPLPAPAKCVSSQAEVNQEPVIYSHPRVYSLKG